MGLIEGGGWVVGGGGVRGGSGVAEDGTQRRHGMSMCDSNFHSVRVLVFWITEVKLGSLLQGLTCM